MVWPFAHPLSGDAAYSGMEIQILDDGHEQYKGIQPYQAHGSVTALPRRSAATLSRSGNGIRRKSSAAGGT